MPILWDGARPRRPDRGLPVGKRRSMEERAEIRTTRKMIDIFGFDGALLRDAVVTRAPAASRSYADGLYPPAAAGIVRWIETVATIREALAPFGYEPDDTDQLAKVIHRARGVAIVPASGSALTGIPLAVARKEPSTKWPRGERTAVAVERNNQLALFGTAEEHAAIDEDPRLLETWVLLQHATTQEVRSELSLPGGMSARGFITTWRERFILPPLDNDGGPVDEPFGDD